MGILLSEFKNQRIDNFINSTNYVVDSVEISSDANSTPIVGNGYSNGIVGLVSSNSTIGDSASFGIVTNSNSELQSISIANPGNYEIPPASLSNVAFSSTGGSGGRINATVKRNNSYFICAIGSDSPNTEVISSIDSCHYKPWKELLFGRRASLQKTIRRVTWTSGVVYDQYDDKITAAGDNFYAVNSSGQVFKCIDNNNSANSTVEPSLSGPIDGLPFSDIADGYQWLYMYTIPSDIDASYGTSQYMPVMDDSDATGAARSGSILRINVETSGSGYPAHSGLLTEVTAGVYRIANTANANDEYYTSCAITATNGNGNTQVLPILSSNSTFYITTDGSLSNGFFVGTVTYSIAPRIIINANRTGNNTNAIASAVMNESTGAIQSITMVSVGSGYTSAEANVVSGVGYGSGASLRVVISPPHGHGFNSAAELHCETLSIRSLFDKEGDATYFPQGVSYNQIGLLHNPSNTAILPFKGEEFTQTTHFTILDSVLSFSNGELVVGSTSTARGRFSFANSTTMIVTGVEGSFNAGELVVGQVSGASREIMSIDKTPDLEIYSGQFVYLNNITSIQRGPTTKENVKLIASF